MYRGKHRAGAENPQLPNPSEVRQLNIGVRGALAQETAEMLCKPDTDVTAFIDYAFYGAIALTLARESQPQSVLCIYTPRANCPDTLVTIERAEGTMHADALAIDGVLKPVNLKK
jgi:hypothetical protein